MPIGPGVETSPGSSLFKRFSDVAGDFAVLVFDKHVASGDRQGDGPLDELQRDQRSQRAVVGEVLRAWHAHPADDRQVHREATRFANALDSVAVTFRWR